MGKRKPKKAWRKADIADVEEALEDDRLVEKLKKPPKNGTDEFGALDALFTVDTAGSCEGLSQKSRREIARAKLFPPKGPKLGLSATEEYKIDRAGRSGKLLGIKRKLPPEEGSFDIWAPKDVPQAKLEEEAHSTVRRPGKWNAPPKVPKLMRWAGCEGTAPAVIPAHEGQSINPHAESYEELVCKAAAAEIERERGSEYLDRRLRPMSSMLVDELGKEKVESMDDAEKLRAYQSLFGGSTEGDGEHASASSSVQRSFKPKSQAQKNKVMKRKAKDAKESQLLTQRKLNRSIGNLGAIQKEIKNQEKMHAERKAYKEALLAEAEKQEETEGIVPKSRKLGGKAFQENALEVADAEIGEKGLRAAKLGSFTNGCVVKDRLTSIVRRGMLVAVPEASKMALKRSKKTIWQRKKKSKFVSPLLRDNLLLR